MAYKFVSSSTNAWGCNLRRLGACRYPLVVVSGPTLPLPAQEDWRLVVVVYRVAWHFSYAMRSCFAAGHLIVRW